MREQISTLRTKYEMREMEVAEARVRKGKIFKVLEKIIKEEEKIGAKENESISWVCER